MKQPRTWMVTGGTGRPVVIGDGDQCYQFAIYPTRREADIIRKQLNEENTDRLPHQVIEITWRRRRRLRK